MPLKLHHRLQQRAYLAYSRIARGMTLGVRAMLLRDGKLILVKHTYLPGWYLPGGGVEAGESFSEALVREIDEEAGAALTAPGQLFGIYRNSGAHRRDHVALFVCREWEQRRRLNLPNFEIAASEPFDLDRLPDGTSPGTLRRIAEVVGGPPPADDW